jgi:hypothetical protein
MRQGIGARSTRILPHKGGLLLLLHVPSFTHNHTMNAPLTGTC